MNAGSTSGIRDNNETEIQSAALVGSSNAHSTVNVPCPVFAHAHGRIPSKFLTVAKPKKYEKSIIGQQAQHS